MNAQTFARLHKAQVRSNISIAAFCRKRGLALSSYHSALRQCIEVLRETLPC